MIGARDTTFNQILKAVRPVKRDNIDICVVNDLSFIVNLEKEANRCKHIV